MVNKKNWKAILQQFVGMIIVSICVRELQYYEVYSFTYFLLLAIGGLGFAITYIGIRKEVKHNEKEHD